MARYVRRPAYANGNATIGNNTSHTPKPPPLRYAPVAPATMIAFTVRRAGSLTSPIRTTNTPAATTGPIQSTNISGGGCGGGIVSARLYFGQHVLRVHDHTQCRCALVEA